MKNFKVLTALFLGLLICGSETFAQEANKASENEAKAKVLIIKDENGKVTELKKEFDLSNQEEMKTFLKDNGVDMDLQELIHPPSEEAIHKLLEDDSSKQIIKMIKLEEEEVNPEATTNYKFKFISDDSAGKVLNIDELLEEGNFELEVNEIIERVEGKEVQSIVFIRRDKSDDGELISTGIEAEKLANMPIEEFKVFPNPNKGQFTTEFEVTEPSDVFISISDSKGAQLYTKELSSFSGKYQEQIDLSKVESGLYFLNIQIGDEVQSNKILIQ